jgi:DNA (cytosine-5)-methyltransferase 1
MSRPRLLDLFCCQGGAAKGYADAGFEVVGVDINPQPRYPYDFYQADALEFLASHWENFDAVHASPPCQAFSNAQKIQGNKHPDFIHTTRWWAEYFGLPYIIENVVGAPLIECRTQMLCGSMFGLGTYRHRLFEANFPLVAPAHPVHVKRTTKMGRKPQPGEMMHVVGNFTGVEQAKKAMGIDWMTRDGLREAIPPRFTQWIGDQLMAHLAQAQVIERVAA